MSGDDSILPKIATHGDGKWVAENHPKSLLVDAVLRLWLCDLLFAGVAGERVFELSVWDETGADLMDVLALEPLLLQ